MKINGQGIYGSHAWRKFGEGEMEIDPEEPNAPAKLRTFPGDKLGKKHIDFKFGIKDFRFTKGKDGSVFAFCLTVPKPGEMLTIKVLGKYAKLLNDDIESVRLLGYKTKLNGAR